MNEQPSDAELQRLQQLIQRVVVANKPLVSALSAYGQELARGSQRRRITRLIRQLEQGGEHIDQEWIPTLVAAAAAPDSSSVASGVFEELQRGVDVRNRIASTLAYPLAMAIASIGIMLFISIWIIPVFREMFTEFALILPQPTLIAIGASEFLLSFGWGALFVAVLVAILLLLHQSTCNWILQKLPVIGGAIRLSDRARFTRYLADLVAVDFAAFDALRICGRDTKDSQLRREAYHLASRLQFTNKHVRDALPLGHRLPRTVIYTLENNANPQAASKTLRELSWVLDRQTHDRMSWIISFVEPAFIVFLGASIGFYVVALFMPLVTLLNGLSG